MEGESYARCFSCKDWTETRHQRKVQIGGIEATFCITCFREIKKREEVLDRQLEVERIEEEVRREMAEKKDGPVAICGPEDGGGTSESAEEGGNDSGSVLHEVCHVPSTGEKGGLT